MAEERRSTPTEDVQRLYEDAEKRTAQAFEEMVSKPSFGELLARMTENVVGLTKIGTDVFDLVLRNLRLAGRADITRLARQQGRTEDKLEVVLVVAIINRADIFVLQPGKSFVKYLIGQGFDVLLID